jgi:hypothetical protein
MLSNAFPFNTPPFVSIAARISLFSSSCRPAEGFKETNRKEFKTL